MTESWRYHEDLYPRCKDCAQPLPGNTSFVIRTNDGRVFQKLKWFVDRLRCPDCHDAATPTKFKRL